MSDAPRITEEQARDVRAHCWAFIFDCHAKKNAVGCDQHRDGDDTKERSVHDFRATNIIQD